MAALLATLDPTMDDNARRPPSVRSVASNNSVASVVSLTRRPRARPRSRTVTGASSARADVPSELLYLDKQLVQEPLPLPEHTPMKSLEAATNTELAAAETTFAEPKSTKASLAPKSSLPAIQTRYYAPPSAFSRDPSLVPNVRDSMSTHQSGASSSLYPLSSSTASGPESPPSPRSLSEQLDHIDAVRIDSEGTGMQEFDGDDVAYRLQLLVKNNYFLPPAHSKPSPSDFAEIAANTPKKQAKPSAPAFMDLFRAVKPKSKPTTPSGSPHLDGPAPMLRATSDSITAPHSVRAQQPRLSTQLPRASSTLPSRGRVVVVREKMGDIAVAAKQAEQDLRNKGVRLDQVPQPPNQDIFDDVIDPTDAVDVPLPSASYPFAVQASALHGLGVQDSLGADVLADRLPPPKSPNVSSSFEADNDWRKVLLHQAVHHSLDNTPDASTFSHIIGASTPMPSTRKRSKSAAPSPDPSNRSGGFFAEGQRGSRDKQRLNLPSSSKPTPQKLPVLATPSEPSPPGYLPARVATPYEALTPLAPPPRHHFAPLLQSFSQTDLGTPSQPPREPRSHSSASRHTLRRAQSSPMLAESEPISHRAFGMSPPPIPHPYPYSDSRVASARTTMSFETIRDHLETVTTSESMYSDDDYDHGAIPRNSMTFSAVMGRPSLSEYSQESLSPTTSAFQEALNHGSIYHTSSSSARHGSYMSFERGRTHVSQGGPSRNSTMSPPPRMSSSLAHVSALPPPPRSANYPYSRHFIRPPSIDSTTTNLDADDTIYFNEPEPTTPPVPNFGRSGNGLSLDIPRRHIPLSIHSAPEPSSPTAFFDTIQSQPNAMDDLESSDESDDEINPMPRPPPQLPSFSVDPRSRAASTASAPVPRSPLMKFGNHSAPYVGKLTETFRQTLLPIGGGGLSHVAAKQPVVNIPPKAPFFTERKSDSGHAPPLTSFDFYRSTQANQHSLVPAASTSRTSMGDRRPSSSGTVASVSSQKAQASFRKLDGMLLQHMVTEKDTIKRIATTMKQSSAPPSSWDERGVLPPSYPPVLSTEAPPPPPSDIQN